MTATAVPKYPDLSCEHALLQQGLSRIAGVDEAGRGAWAGPVVAAAVILPINKTDLIHILHGVRDSKQMTATQRSRWAEEIKSCALTFGTGFSSCTEVDQTGLIPATHAAMQQAIQALSLKPEYVLIDYVTLPGIKIPQMAITHGDAHSLSIAAASVLAKTARDEFMQKMEASYPGYGFARNKGYGTRQHREALQLQGACSLHRHSYRPIAALNQQPLPLQPHKQKTHPES